MCKIIVTANRKGGCGKTMTAASLAYGLAKQGLRVLSVDADPQHSLTVSFGVTEPDRLTISLATVMTDIISENETEFNPAEGIIRHSEGVDLMPANNALSGVELALVQTIGRETVFRQYIDKMKPHYDAIVIDTSPSLGLLTINALAAADSVIIPVAPKFLDAKGLELLLKTISQVKRQINPNLKIDGILLTMTDKRSKFTREIISLIEGAYGGKIRIFGEYIPQSVRAAETSANGKSIFAHDPHGRMAAAYYALVKEVVGDE